MEHSVTQTTPDDLRSVIAGERLDRADKPLISTNPARTGEVLAEVSLAGRAEFTAACRAAKEAQRAWAAVPAPIRGQVIGNIGDLVAANKEALARAVTRDIGKTLGEARGEVQGIIDTCEFFRHTVASESPHKPLFTFRIPLGAVAIITAGSFPEAVPSWYIVPALLTGNTAVWKPAEYAASCSWAFYELFYRAGLPKGVLNLA